MVKIWVVEGRDIMEDGHWVEEYYDSEDKAFEKLEELNNDDAGDNYRYQVTGPHYVK